LTLEYEGEEARRKGHNLKLIEENSEIGAEIEDIKRNYYLHKDQVVDMLLNQILVVNIEVPKVVQQRFE
jgi:hypothetical protein